MPDREERDWLAELGRAWGSLEAPDPTPESADAQTEAALGWMRAAWTRVEAPSPGVPVVLRWRGLSRRRGELYPILSAAALLVVVAWVVRITWVDELGRGPGAGPRTTDVAEAPVDELDGPRDAGAAPRTPLMAAPKNEDGSIVLEHGSVRLLLLTPITESDPGLANDKEN